MNEILYWLQTNPLLQYIFLGLGILLGTCLNVYIIYSIFFKRRIKEFHSHWNTLIEGLSYSTLDFYVLVEEELFSQEISGISTKVVKLREGGLFSRRRLYLRVRWKDFHYDMCGAVFGDNFFVSSWLLYRHKLIQLILSRIPFFGNWLARVFFPITYYKIDEASIFQTYAHSCLMKVIDRITKEKGLRSIPENKRIPTIKPVDLSKR